MAKYIEQWKVASDKPTIITNGKDQPVYDMYKIEIRYNTGEMQIKKVFCEHGTIIPPQIKSQFFWWNLWGDDGLIKRQGRDDYIFLGRIEEQQGEYKFNRFYLMSDGQTTAQEYFDTKAYPEIKKTLENQAFREIQPIDSEKTTNNDTSGKTYVISDIHGMYGSYMEAIRQLNKNDTLVVLGDAIDRGKNGISILKDIMQKQKEGNGPRVMFLLGNHEMQMIECLDILKKYRPTKDELEMLCQLGKFLYLNWNVSETNESIARMLVEEKPYFNFSKRDMVLLYIWIKASRGQATFDEYDTLPPKEQEEIYVFLTKKSFIYAKKEIDNKNVLFVHALPPFSQESIDMCKTHKEAGVKYSDIGNSKVRKELLSHCTETRREKQPFKLWKDEGYYTIYGHTPNLGKIVNDEENGCLCIDSGCGQREEKSRLALYCVDDRTVKYLEEKEEDKAIIPGDGGDQPR